ncbi:DinB superfamily protein [compost metagenome]
MEAKSEEAQPFFIKYTQLVPDGNIFTILEEQIEETCSLLHPLSEAQASFRYASDKWSIKDVVGHITDNERIWAYRLLRIARGDNQCYPSYEQNQFVREAQFDRIPFADVLAELKCVRASTVFLLKSLPAEAWQYQGLLNEDLLSVHQAAYAIAGHEIHHRRILTERYLSSFEHFA